ncbi:bifunctional DNA-formamidopyrimidine glycosylase/DNA-(apurinic or apyrimidinic site) lyase [Acaricomes phytoseiuli]|uniref:bifunctional DNA-formamidopyrimidine glycosylase/DNA-(apurinic or apyrimidinic site) lyase n=1 Tax=Acaricomes phytoseiuli TaxID=291968 RepID=UPI0003656801|nr:bifunctional DNA-formamidopyrimidine glycosylase/DNA-(apurinic or apyrimidinic site) lyase [Acaricomes phytoseiuli]MCW1249610.1 bifunctional DNA-formamidopyrimidine glycosylase/DNA-(apurinic or apyrimidinic site) lyase [Acaricomes phytoseiuli]
MPELPEVEVVRSGLERWAAGRVIEDVEVLDPRSLRRHASGTEDFRARLLGRRLERVVRRGKFLWLPLSSNDSDPTADPGTYLPEDYALLAHLGMSGQLLIQPESHPDERHLKVRLRLAPRADAPPELRFIDQRIFGGMHLAPLIPTPDGLPAGAGDEDNRPGLIAAEAAHIARDPLDPYFDERAFIRTLRRKATEIKRALLDQTLISGIGNIYADEALWASRIHYARPAARLTGPQISSLLTEVRAVMRSALAAGGTSFDSLYVNVNGSSGYFERSLQAYGREGQPCSRCQSLIRREPFMNRSSYFCPRCQSRPRTRRVG